MAIHVGEWRGNVVNGLIPGTTWSPVPGAITFQIRNDSGLYSFNYSTSTVTLPSSNLADGYLLVAAFEYVDTSGGRVNIAGRIVQSSGTGNAVAPITGGYSRDNSENASYTRTWAFVNNPSASSQFTFEWQRDADVPTGGTVRAVFEVMSFYYDSVGMYSSTSAAQYGGTTPNQVQNLGTVYEGTGTSRVGNSVSLVNNDKRYLVLGSGFMDAVGNTRTQRWFGVRENGTKLDYIKGYVYLRNNNNDMSGAMFSGIIEKATAAKSIDLFAYTGDGVNPGDGGANQDGGTPVSAEYYLVIVELNDSTSCVQATNGASTTNINQPVITDLPSFNNVLINHGTYFSNVGANGGVTAAAAQDSTWLAGANVSCAAVSVADSGRFTGHAQFFRDTTLQNETFHGNYLRNNQGNADTFGWSANQMSTVEMTTGQEFKNTARRLVGSAGGGDPTTNSNWVGTWAISLESMLDTPATSRRIISIT